MTLVATHDTKDYFIESRDVFLLPNLITLSRLFISIYLFNQHSYTNFPTVNLVVIVLIGIQIQLMELLQEDLIK